MHNYLIALSDAMAGIARWKLLIIGDETFQIWNRTQDILCPHVWFLCIWLSKQGSDALLAKALQTSPDKEYGDLVFRGLTTSSNPAGPVIWEISIIHDIILLSVMYTGKNWRVQTGPLRAQNPL